MKSEWCDFWFKIKEEEGRKEVYSLGKKSTERRFDWKVSMYRWTSALRIEICDVNIFPVSGFEPLLLSAKGREGKLSLRIIPQNSSQHTTPSQLVPELVAVVIFDQPANSRLS